jgi:Zn-dependent protease with chaperone function
VTPPITLVVFAVLAATFGPRLLTRSPWLERSPRLGILAWQALSVSVVAAVVLSGAALALPAVPFSTDIAELLSACAMALRAQYATPGGAALSATGAVLAVSVVARAGYCLTVGVVTAARQRRRQVDALTLIARRHDGCDAMIVDNVAAGAYCLPGRRQLVVLTTGALAALDEDQLAAVLAHERAHLRGRHDLVLTASAALLRAFPPVPAFRNAHRELTRLVEMLADDVAARRNDRLTIATALVRLAEASAPVAALGAGGSTSLARVRRLVAPAHPLGATRSVLTALATAALLATPVAVVTAPAVVAATADLCPIDFPGQTLA